MRFMKTRARNPFQGSKGTPASEPSKRPGAGASPPRPGRPSLRRACFEAFDRGQRPIAYARENHLNPGTALTYFRDWKKARQPSGKIRDPKGPGKPDLSLDGVVAAAAARTGLPLIAVWERLEAWLGSHPRQIAPVSRDVPAAIILHGIATEILTGLILDLPPEAILDHLVRRRLDLWHPHPPKKTRGPA